MKKGVVLYVTQGRDDVPLLEDTELTGLAQSLGAVSVSVALNEQEVSYRWWELIAKGMHQVLLVMAFYDAALETFEFRGDPVRLCG